MIDFDKVMALRPARRGYCQPMIAATTGIPTMPGYQAMTNAIDLKLFKLDSSR